MPEIVTMGELLCEIMRPHEGMELYETGDFKGPFPAVRPGFLLAQRRGLAALRGLSQALGMMISGKILLTGLKKMV